MMISSSWLEWSWIRVMIDLYGSYWSIVSWFNHSSGRPSFSRPGRLSSAGPAREERGEYKQSPRSQDCTGGKSSESATIELAFGNDVCFGSEAILYIKTILCSDASLYSLTTLHAHHTLHPLVRARLRLSGNQWRWLVTIWVWLHRSFH